MFRPIATVFIVAVAVQATFAFIDQQRESLILKLSDKDMIKTNSDSYLKPRNINTYLGTLSAGDHREGERMYVARVERKNNYENTVLVVDVSLSVPGTIIHFVSAENIDGSEAVVCETARTLGSSNTVIHIRIAPRSTAKLYVRIGVH